MTGAPAAAGSATLPRRRYHFHFPGVMYVAVTLFVALGAINSQNNLLFLALGLAMGGLLVSGILSGASLLGLRLERTIPAHGIVGRPMVVRYTLANRNHLFPAFGLSIAELPSPHAGRTPTWPAHFPSPHAFIAGVAAAASSSAEATVTPSARGRADLLSARVSSTFPFGLARKSITFDLPQTILVLPPELRLRSGVIDRLTARSPHGVGGERNPGSGDEFFGLREYAPGDSPRQIAWRRTARTGELVVRQNTAPTPLRLWVVLRGSGAASHPPGADQGADADSAAAIERAVALAAAVLRNAADEDIAVGLAIPAVRVMHPPRLGRVHLERLLVELAMLDGPSLMNDSAQGFPDQVAHSGACAIVHTGPIDPLFGPRHARHLTAESLDSLLEDSAANRQLLAYLRPAPAEERRLLRVPFLNLSGSRGKGAAA